MNTLKDRSPPIYFKMLVKIILFFNSISMGRTLHYTVINSEKITKEEKLSMLKISDFFNSGDFKDVWTCENFYLNPKQYYPNWNNGSDWNKIEQRYAKLESEGLNSLEIIEKLIEEGLAKANDINPERIWGFTKVAGNEYNAFLVYMALITISKVTKAKIRLRDEGEFLYGPVLIKSGKVKINKEESKKDWKYWGKNDWIATNKYNVLNKMTKQKELIKQYPEYTDKIFEFCRNVEPADFKDYAQYNAGQIMAGFYGEYYSLNKEDPETLSYKMLDSLTTALGKAGFQKKDIKVTPEIPK